MKTILLGQVEVDGIGGYNLRSRLHAVLPAGIRTLTGLLKASLG